LTRARPSGSAAGPRRDAEPLRARVQIRRARRADCAELTRIAHAAKRHWGYPERLIRLWRADLTVTPEFVVRQPVYCALDGEAVLGFYAVSGEGVSAELEHLWVDPPHIGLGVGRALVDHLVRRLRRAGVARLAIASDPNAEGFYRRLGARRVGSVASTPAGRHLPRLVLRLDRQRGSGAVPPRRARQ
jgi:ribosomal protein S18 acetylase RimI-like enzyme